MRRCSIFVLYSLEVGMDMLPLVALIGGSTTSLSATGARRFVVFFSADDDRQFLPCAPWSLAPIHMALSLDGLLAQELKRVPRRELKSKPKVVKIAQTLSWDWCQTGTDCRGVKKESLRCVK